MPTIRWADEADADSLSQAGTVLSLLGVDTFIVAQPVGLRYYLAKDILRCAQASPLPRDNAGVKKYLDRYRKGTEVGPVLIVKGLLLSGLWLFVPDGWHRVCAGYHLDEGTSIATVALDVRPEPSEFSRVTIHRNDPDRPPGPYDTPHVGPYG